MEFVETPVSRFEGLPGLMTGARLHNVAQAVLPRCMAVAVLCTASLVASACVGDRRVESPSGRSEAPPRKGAEPATVPPADASPDMASLTQCPKKEDPGIQMCAEMYDPVCAAIDTKVRCLRQPCPEPTQWVTFSNECFACREDGVLGYRRQACPDATGEAWPAP